MRRAGPLVATVVVVGVTLLCVRLGVWQIRRYHEKRRMNAELRQALAARPLRLRAPLPAAPGVVGKVVEVEGRYDSTCDVLLAGREHQGMPGVEVLTALRLRGAAAVLVDRGWLFAPDPTTVRPESFPDTGWRTVRGVAEPLVRRRGRGALRRLPGGGVIRLLGLSLNPDTLAARLPYRLAEFTIRELPGPGVPSQPVRSAPEPFEEGMHLSYAIQWFAIAVIVAGGAIVLAGRAARRTRETSPPGGTS